MVLVKDLYKTVEDEMHTLSNEVFYKKTTIENLTASLGYLLYQITKRLPWKQLAVMYDVACKKREKSTYLFIVVKIPKKTHRQLVQVSKEERKTHTGQKTEKQKTKKSRDKELLIQLANSLRFIADHL